MSDGKLGSLISATFGLILVLVNTGSVPIALAVLLRGLGVLAFLTVQVAARRRGPATGTRAAAGGFGRRYWFIVVAEVVAIVVGLALLRGPLDTPRASVAWISSVVGVHFFALAVVWSEPLFRRLGAALLACGVAGLVLAARVVDAGVIDLTSGVLPGAILLGFGLWGSTRGRRSPGFTRGPDSLN